MGKYAYTIGQKYGKLPVLRELDTDSYRNLLANGYTDEMAITGIDKSEGYSPDNCKFIPSNKRSKKKPQKYSVITFEVRVQASMKDHIEEKLINMPIRIDEKVVGHVYKVEYKKYPENVGFLRTGEDVCFLCTGHIMEEGSIVFHQLNEKSRSFSMEGL